MKICTNCILPETFLGASFNAEGICIHCQKVNGHESKLSEDKQKYAQKFQVLLGQLTQPNQRSYDILMAYSGGKDSTYTMSLLKNKYGLRVLALSFDNGFLSDIAIANIKKVTDTLGIDQIFFKPHWNLLKKIFRISLENKLYSKKAIERASTICTSCMGLVKAICLKMAIEQRIPMIAFGWSPGQAPIESSIMKNNPLFVKSAQQTFLNAFKGLADSEIENYFLQNIHYSNSDIFPYNVHPMAWEYYN